MKKRLISLVLFFIIVSVSACSENTGNETQSTSKDGVLEITEKMFVEQINDIYINTDDYLGRTIRYEGLVDSFTLDENNMTYYTVIRYGPGCCGTDSNCGFEVIWPESETGRSYPADNDWVEVTGVLEEYEEDGDIYIRLSLTSLNILDVRGKAYVYQ